MRAPCKKVALIPHDWVKREAHWNGRIHLFYQPLRSRAEPGIQMGSISAAQICITQTDELKWLNWARWSEKKKEKKENEFPSELGNDGNGKGYIIYFSHWNNYGINLSFQCDSPLNPLYHNEFDVLDSLGKNLTLLTNKTALPIIPTKAISSHQHTCAHLPLVQVGQLIGSGRLSASMFCCLSVM